MSVISSEIKSFLNSQKLGYVATVSPDGKPNISPKGTIISWTSDLLAFANIRSPDTMSNLKINSAMEINACRLALWQIASRIDAGEEMRSGISMLKIQASEMLGRVVDRAVQIYGGAGYCRDLPIERYYRDARISRIYDGTSEVHRLVMAKELIKGDVSLYDCYEE